MVRGQAGDPLCRGQAGRCQAVVPEERTRCVRKLRHQGRETCRVELKVLRALPGGTR